VFYRHNMARPCRCRSYDPALATHPVIGSVAEACIRNATCPVLVIPVARINLSAELALATARS
jgi:hypothetical protein